MSKTSKNPQDKSYSRRGFIAGVTVGATGAILGREAVAQTIHLGNLDDLPDNWWELPDGWWNNPNPDPEPDPDPPVTDPPPDPDNGGVVDVPPPDPEPTVAVRRNIYALDPNGAEVASLRQGIQAMQARPITDPTSWLFQANVHGISGNIPPGLSQGMLSTWGTCRHANRFFLSWHRIYLYFFERILRAASGNPSLTLPYWDYSVPGQSAMPAAFRFPQDTSNPLFVSQRFGAGINQGTPLPPHIVDTFRALQTTSFQRFAPSVEQAPHNGVHVAIGGPGGWMTDPRLAARDPIFWLHHCNVDRLWNRWVGLGGGRRQPTDDAQFMNDRYFFFDENGNRIGLSGAEVLDTAGQLGYRYDDDPVPPIGFSPDDVLIAAADTTEPDPFGGAESAMLMAADFQVAETPLAESAGGVSLGFGRAGVKLQPEPVPLQSMSIDGAEAAVLAAPEPGAQFKTDTAAAEAQPVILELSQIDFDTPPGVWYDIYVNLPAGAPPDPRGPYFAGTFAPFAQNKSEAKATYDITGLLNRQIDAGLFGGGEVDVQFVASQETGSAEAALIPPVNVGRVRIVRP